MKQGKAGRRSILLAWTLLLFVLFGCGKTADNADGGSKEKGSFYGGLRGGTMAGLYDRKPAG